MSEKRSKKGILLIIGGALLAAITLGGFYLSKNPDVISSWKYKRDSARQDSMRDTLLTASPECQSVSTDIFTNACKILETHDYETELAWDKGFSEQAKSCALTSFRDTTLFKLEYEGSPKSQLENLEDAEGITLHLCGIVENLEFYHPDFKANNAAELINKWHQWKHSEGNFYD